MHTQTHYLTFDTVQITKKCVVEDLSSGVQLRGDPIWT